MASDMIITIIDGVLVLLSFIMLLKSLSIRGKNTGNSNGIDGNKMPNKNMTVFYCCAFILLGIGWSTLKFTGIASEGLSGISSGFDSEKLPDNMKLSGNDFDVLLHSTDDKRYELLGKIGCRPINGKTPEEEKSYKCFNISKNKENFGKLYFHKSSRNFVLKLKYEGDYNYYIKYLSQFTSNINASGRKQFQINQTCYINDLGLDKSGDGYLFLIKDSN